MTTALLSTEIVARFVARGFVRLDSIVPDEVNAAAIEEMQTILSTWGSDARPDAPDSGERLSEIYPEPSAIGRMLRTPQVDGAIRSLVGQDPAFDHDFVHAREARDLSIQHLHADAIIDPTLAFDVQLFYFPHDVAPGEGGTGFIPGSHLRHVNHSDVARYRHLIGEEEFSGDAGTILIFHHGLWHRAMPNRGDRRRLMYKIRLNPRDTQVRRWDTSDLDAMHNGPEDHIFARFAPATVAAQLRAPEPWQEHSSYRIELTQRARLWRYLTGDDGYDVDYYLTRSEQREHLAPGSTS